MDITKVKISTVRYAVTKCEISSPNLTNNYSVPNDCINEIIIDDDFEGFYFPFFQLNLTLPSWVQRAIKKTPLDIHISFSMQAQYYTDYDNQGDLSPNSTSVYINKKYIAYIEKQDRSLLDSVLEDVEEGLDYGLKSTDPQTMEICMFTLYDEDLLNATGTTVNDIISSGCLIDILTYVLNCAGISNVLMSPPNNYKTYKQFILPPISADDHIDRICNDFGIHTNGTLIYFGLDRNYIIDRVPKCTAYGINEYQTTYLYYPGEGAESLAMSTGCAKSSTEKTNYILLQPTSFRFTDKSVAAEAALASDIAVLDHLNGGSGSGGFAIKLGGDNNKSGVLRKVASFKKTISLGLRNVDLAMLTPNKNFVVTIDDIKHKAYNGSYMLTRCTTTFVKEGNQFTPLSVCEFRC